MWMHQYEDLDEIYVWEVVQESIPVLKEQIEKWISELSA